jgi:hypothetical protein
MHTYMHACIHTGIQKRDKVVAEGGQRGKTVRVYGVSHLGTDSEKYSVYRRLRGIHTYREHILTHSIGTDSEKYSMQ